MSSFDARAKEWDKLPARVRNAKNIAEAIKRRVDLTSDMEIIDFGVGTGLLGFEIASKVKKVYGIDTSKQMLQTLKEKNTPALSIEPIYHDITKERLDFAVEGVVSSMTLHHIKDLEDFFTKIYHNVKSGGFIAIADLEKEDGTFHSDNTGVHHFGFEKEMLTKIVKDAGFKEVCYEHLHTIEKPHRTFGVFLLTAKK